MPRGGHNVKPTKLKVLHGTARPDRVSPDEPQPKVAYEIPVPPSHLDRFGKQVWRLLAAELHRLGLLTEVDLPAFAAYCDTYGQWRKASAVLQKMDVLDEDYRRVAVSVEKARNDMRLAGNEFGLTPASRARLSVGSESQEEDGILGKMWKSV